MGARSCPPLERSPAQVPPTHDSLFPQPVVMPLDEVTQQAWPGGQSASLEQEHVPLVQSGSQLPPTVEMEPLKRHRVAVQLQYSPMPQSEFEVHCGEQAVGAARHDRSQASRSVLTSPTAEWIQFDHSRRLPTTRRPCAH